MREHYETTDRGVRFGGGRAHTFGFMNLDLTVRPTRAAHQLLVIDAQTAYHVLLRRPRSTLQSYSIHILSVLESYLEKVDESTSTVLSHHSKR